MVTADRKNKKIVIQMADFIKGTEVRMPSSRGRLEEKLTPAQMTEFRSSIGCLQWCTSTCRPDMAADTSLLQKGASELQVKDACEAHRVITTSRALRTMGL